METGNPAIANVRRKFDMLPLAVRLSVTMSIGTYLCSWFTPLNRFIAMCPQLFLFRLQGTQMAHIEAAIWNHFANMHFFMCMPVC